MNAPDAPAVALVTTPPPLDEAHTILTAWSWILPARIQPVGVNRFADWYVATPDGGVHLLSIWEGLLASVASSFDEWRAWLATETGMEANWSELVIGLYDRGLRLADGECFAFVPPPIGDVGIDVDRIVVSKIGAITTTMGHTFGQLHRP